MSYRVIHYFTDLQDFNHPYRVGDKFPRDGIKVSEERLKELSGSKNKQKRPLIEPVKDTAESEEKEENYTKTEINRMSTSELKELATKEEIDSAESMTGSELKKILIEHFNL